MDRPSVDILCGFLGSGKTTLLRYVLEHGLDGRRVAIVMNEIGDIGIDGRVIEGLNVDQMVELNSGCICCSVSGRLGPAMREILDNAQPEHIIIETTGVADVQPIVASLEAIDLYADAIITVVDADSFPMFSTREPIVVRQVQAADFIVLNKTDLVDARRLKKLVRMLQRINPTAEVSSTRWGQVQATALFGYGLRAPSTGTLTDDDHRDAVDDEISSFVFESRRPLRRESFVKLVRRWPRHLYRCKGFTCFAGEEYPRLFNYVCGRMHMEWLPSVAPSEEQSTNLVFIGRNLTKVRPRIMTSLRSCEVDSRRKTSLTLRFLPFIR